MCAHVQIISGMLGFSKKVEDIHKVSTDLSCRKFAIHFCERTPRYNVTVFWKNG